ncbi:MAG TPA: hypothetical protein VNJ02_00265 [Vicinamibacterales bacterium]|nr:hypothetical protein [Vicinamibacterales bacterium]
MANVAQISQHEIEAPGFAKPEAWVATLRARGVSVFVRNNRLWLQPAGAYKALSDEELIVLRHNRAEIKAIASGDIAAPVETIEPAPVEHVEPAPAPAPQLPVERWAAVGLYRENGVITHALGDAHAQRILRGEITNAIQVEQRARRAQREMRGWRSGGPTP